jgi:hypothetical protein
VGLLLAIAAVAGVDGFGQGASAATAAEPEQGRSSSAPEQPVILAYGTPGTRVIVREDTLIRVMTDQTLSSKRSRDGQPVSFTVSEDVVVDHVLVIPRGANVRGEVVQAKKAGVVAGSSEMTFKLESLELGGERYPLYAYHLRVIGTSKEKPKVANMEGAAVVGALAGAVVSARSAGGATPAKNAKDMGAGAAAGAGVVALAEVAAPRPVLTIPAESQMDFYLASPISVQPLGEKEAAGLAQRVYAGGPVLYVRGETP